MPYSISELSTPELLAQAKKVSTAIADKIRGHGTPFEIPYVAYLFYKLSISEHNYPNSHHPHPLPPEEVALMQLNRFRSGEIALNPYILSSLDRYIKNSFVRAYKVYEDFGDQSEVYAALVLLASNGVPASSSIIRLAQAILGIEGGDRVADICCGDGNFITESFETYPGAQYFGFEINVRRAAMLAMRSDILGANPSIVMGDIEHTLSNERIKFDKIFSNYPLGSGITEYDRIAPTLPFKIGRNASDWYFNNVIIGHLAENGRAVAIAGAGSTWNVAGREAREYFIDHGYIEAVISLPSGLMSGTAISPTMYVFSHGNREIRLVNAEDIITVQDRYNKTLSEADLVEILNLFRSDSERSLVITPEEARAKDCSLAFKSYSSSLPNYENATPLSEVATIFRGTLNPRSSTTTKNTGRYLLQISDLENGSIKKELDDDRFIETEELRPEQKLLPYDLIISRIAQPLVKVAIVSPHESRELYPNGNMFVVRLQNPDVNPYYLLSFLLSLDGQEALSYASTGSTIKIISTGTLSQLVFPFKHPDEQRKIAEQLSESMAQYEAYMYKANLAKIRIENSYYYDEEN